jgi:hypothetical protein
MQEKSRRPIVLACQEYRQWFSFPDGDTTIISTVECQPESAVDHQKQG